jgi:quinolinate synthase
MAVLNTNVDEIKVAIKNRQSRETDNIPDEERRIQKLKQQHNTICVGHHYVQINTNNLNKT